MNRIILIILVLMASMAGAYEVDQGEDEFKHYEDGELYIKASEITMPEPPSDVRFYGGCFWGKDPLIITSGDIEQMTTQEVKGFILLIIFYNMSSLGFSNDFTCALQKKLLPERFFKDLYPKCEK